MTKIDLWKQRLPLLISSMSLLIVLYLFGWSWTKSISLLVGQYQETKIVYGEFLFGSGLNITILHVAFFTFFAALTWLFSTRVKFYQTNSMRLFTFLLALITAWGVILGFGLTKVKLNVIPFFEDRLKNIIETDGFFESIVFEQTRSFYFLLILIPLLVLFYATLFLTSKYLLHDEELNSAFFEFQWNGRWLQKFSEMEVVERWPDVELGPDSYSGEMVMIKGKDRTLNTFIVGAIGTGKTAALATPILKQDLDHLVTYINKFPHIYKQKDFKSEEVSGKYLSGISVIDPSNDLCQDVLKLVKAHSIPEESITYINPLDPNTPSINPMQGPVDKVAEVFAQVIAGLNDSKDGGNFFFEQAQRNHLKHYIYLLKLHDPNKEVILDMLLDMYNNPQIVRRMHVQLKETFPEKFDELEDRDERNYWKIVQGIDEWFDLNLLPLTSRGGTFERNEDNEIIYYDAKAEHVQGLRNILNDIGANPLIRRVLFGSSDFDFDRHMELGGVLLVNTAKGELVNLARVLGKIVLMNLQNATFRRTPKVSSYHHILVDEAPDYLYNSFREFPAQSRKYKVIITTLKQTIAQLADQFGEHYMTTIIGAMRNRMVYGDVPAFDANYFASMFGEKYDYEESQNEMIVSPLQEDPMSRSGSTYSKVRAEKMTSSQIMYQEAFQCSVKIVVDNKPMPVTQIDANFVPREEFVQSKIVAIDENAKVWIEERRRFGMNVDADIEVIQSIEETESENAEFYDDKYNSKPQANDLLEEEAVEKAINITSDPHPRTDINYQKEELGRFVEEDVIDISGVVANELRSTTHIEEKRNDNHFNPLEASSIEVFETDKFEVEKSVSELLGISEWSPEETNEITDEKENAPEIRGDYKQSQLSAENKEFLRKFGEGVSMFEEQ